MNRKVLTISFFLLCIMGFAVILTACSQNFFVGSRTVEAGFYQLDIDSMTEFSVNISESGTYSIYVEAHHAKGTVYIQQKGEKKDAR